MRKLFTITILATLVPGCVDDPQLDETSDDVIIGTNDFQDVEAYTPKSGSPFGPRYVEYYKGAVGRDNFGCSGTLIGRDLFLTAAHCAHAGVIDFNYELTYANGTNTNAIASDTYNIAGIVECGFQSKCDTDYNLRSTDASHQRDFAVLRVQAKSGIYPGDVWGWRFLSTSDPATLASQDVPMALIQHPGGDPKKVDTGNVTTWDGWNLNHNADSLPGSSGSGVLDVAGRIIMLNDSQGSTSNYGPAMRDVINFSTVLKGPLTGNSYQLVHGLDGTCLDVPGYSKANGAAIAVNGCKSSGYYANQEVEFVPAASGGSTVVLRDSQLCLDAGSAPANGSLVTQTACTSATQQTWDAVQTGSDGTSTQFVIQSRLDRTKCVAPDASHWLRLAPCGSNATFAFTPTSRSYSLVLDSTSQCLDMTGYSTGDGIVPQVYGCKTDATDRFNQEWQLQPGAGGNVTIVNAFSQKCLDVSGAVDGTLIPQRTCTTASNQRFAVVAQTANRFTFVSASSGKCLDVYNGALRERTCGTSTATQFFRLGKGVN